MYRNVVIEMPQTETARPKCPVTETAQTETAQTETAQTETARTNRPNRNGQTESVRPKSPVPVIFLHWQHNWYPYKQLATYALSCLCIPVCNAIVESSPSPGFRRRGAKNHKGGIFFQYKIGCMQQPGG